MTQEDKSAAEMSDDELITLLGQLDRRSYQIRKRQDKVVDEMERRGMVDPFVDLTEEQNQ